MGLLPAAYKLHESNIAWNRSVDMCLKFGNFKQREGDGFMQSKTAFSRLET